MGWASALVNYATSDWVSTIGDYLVPDLIFGETGDLLNTVVGDMAVGAIVGGATAALTGGDVLKGAAIGGAVGGVAGYAVNPDGGNMAKGLLSDLSGESDEAGGVLDTKLEFGKDGSISNMNKFVSAGQKATDKLSSNEKLLSNGTILGGVVGGIQSYYDNKNAEKAASKAQEAAVAMQDQMNNNAIARDDATYDRTKAKFQSEVVAPQALASISKVGVKAPTIQMPHQVGLLEGSIA
jgi:hypothetical protein